MPEARGLPLRVGQPAPGFELLDHTGKTFRLEDQRGNWLVLWWFPKASTGG